MLEANWEGNGLENIAVVGNSFAAYVSYGSGSTLNLTINLKPHPKPLNPNPGPYILTLNPNVFSWQAERWELAPGHRRTGLNRPERVIAAAALATESAVGKDGAEMFSLNDTSLHLFTQQQ